MFRGRDVLNFDINDFGHRHGHGNCEDDEADMQCRVSME